MPFVGGEKFRMQQVGALPSPSATQHPLATPLDAPHPIPPPTPAPSGHLSRYGMQTDVPSLPLHSIQTCAIDCTPWSLLTSYSPIKQTNTAQKYNIYTLETHPLFHAIESVFPEYL